jgi:hypothetical protein
MLYKTVAMWHRLPGSKAAGAQKGMMALRRNEEPARFFKDLKERQREKKFPEND